MFELIETWVVGGEGTELATKTTKDALDLWIPERPAVLTEKA